jgi:broad specificity phosphatase PhoE
LPKRIRGPLNQRRVACLRRHHCLGETVERLAAERLAAERPRHVNVPYPGGQSYRDVAAAMDEFLRDLAANWDGSKVLIVAHSANRWALDVLLTGASLAELVGASFAWQEGWHYTLPSGCTGLRGNHAGR